MTDWTRRKSVGGRHSLAVDACLAHAVQTRQNACVLEVLLTGRTRLGQRTGSHFKRERWTVLDGSESTRLSFHKVWLYKVEASPQNNQR